MLILQDRPENRVVRKRAISRDILLYDCVSCRVSDAEGSTYWYQVMRFAVVEVAVVVVEVVVIEVVMVERFKESQSKVAYL